MAWMHGPHQVAQKSSTTTFPLASANRNFLPSRSSRSKSGAGLPTSGDSVPVELAGRSAVGRQRRFGGFLELPWTITEQSGLLLDTAAEEELVHLAESDSTGAEDLALAQDRSVGDLFGRERDADSVVAEGLDLRRRGRRLRLLRRVELVGVEPDDPRDPVARHFFVLQARLDLEPLPVHQDDVPSEVVAVPRADQVGGRAGLLHPGKREQSLALDLAEPDRVVRASRGPAPRP